MATYKKRGFKNKASSSKAEALEKKSTTANVFNTLDAVSYTHLTLPTIE